MGYWKERPYLVSRVNCEEILKQQEKTGTPLYKRGTKLAKQLTKGNPKHYIPNPFKGLKKMYQPKTSHI